MNMFKWNLKYIIFLLGVGCCPAGVVAQTNVAVSGTLEGAAGKHVELYAYDEMLTLSEVLLDSATTDTAGAFLLRCYANYPRLVYLQVECYTQSFYVEPGRTYRVYLPEFDWNMDERRNVHLDPVALPLEFMDIDSNELNLRIMRFEAVVDSFLDAHRLELDFRYKPDKRVWKELKQLVKSRFGDSEEDFFGRYVNYQLAEMGLAIRFESRKGIFSRYIKDQPIRYHDESYMRLFLALYEHSISGGTKRIGKHRLVSWVDDGALDRYVDTLGLDPLLENEQVRELAVLEALKESYYDGDYDKERVKSMVQRLGETSKFPEHRRLAQRLSASLARGEHGREVPELQLPDLERQRVDLADLKGKWVYLSFVRVGDPNSIKEIETMAHFRDSVYSKYPDVVFVSVCCDREFQKMYHFLKNSRKGARYDWTWLHFDGNYRLLESYGVVSYPAFVLLNPEGKRVYDYTPAPASGILLNGPWTKTQKDK